MFEQIDLEKDVDSIVAVIERNCNNAHEMRRQIRELQQQSEVTELVMREEKIIEPAKEEKVIEEELDDEMKTYIDEYRVISGDDEESLIALLPEPDDYRYKEIIYRLQAESLKEIKEMMEIMSEELNPSDECSNFIANERKKIAILGKLLLTEEEKEEKEEEKNIIILAPTESGRIRMLDDIDSMPRDFYGDVYTLLQSIINGSFKRLKRFNLCTNANLGRVFEVKSQKIRVVFQRVNLNTYAIISTFLKKTDFDHGYQEYMRTIINEYKKVEDRLKGNLNNPEFVALNDQYVQEMWNKLGVSEDAKTYGKGGIEC